MVELIKPSRTKIIVSIFVTLYCLYPFLAETLLGCAGKDGFSIECRSETGTAVGAAGLLVWYFSSYLVDILMLPLTPLFIIVNEIWPNFLVSYNPEANFISAIFLIAYSYLLVSAIQFLVGKLKKAKVNPQATH